MRTSLLEDVVMATGIDGCKRGLDRCMEERSIRGYWPRRLKGTSVFRRSQPLNPSVRNQRRGRALASVPCCWSSRRTGWPLCETRCWMRWTLPGLIQQGPSGVLRFLKAGRGILYQQNSVGENQPPLPQQHGPDPCAPSPCNFFLSLNSTFGICSQSPGLHPQA